MSIGDMLSVPLILAGTLFFIAGTVGMLRFPDIYMRLHALTKADTLGLGCIVAGLLVRGGDLATAFKLLLIWLLAVVASTSIGHLVGHAAQREGVAPWQRR